jgi:uncharacterized membrane protein YgcG
MKWLRRFLPLLLSSLLVVAPVQVPAQAEPLPSGEIPPVTQQSAEELDQLVAPIALYPDALVAQILAAATYPAQVVEADRWLQENPDLKGDALAQAINTQSWDPSAKALTQFPSVLAMMDRNLSWTSSLGDAYVNEQQNVLDAVQVMRQRAQRAGNLTSTPQESVTTQAQTIVIEPADPDVVYVPEYDPWVVYGAPLPFYPGWIEVPGVFIDGPGIEFGLGIGIGVFAGFGWGWHHWETDWRGHRLTYDHHRYDSHSITFINRHDFGRGQSLLARPGGLVHGDLFPHPGNLSPGAGAAPRDGGFSRGALSGIHSSAFSGFNHGGVASTFSARGRGSFGGGFHGGGSHGGGFHGGGGHR